MTAKQAMVTTEYVESVVSGCESVDELDKAGDYETAMADCPEHFNAEQKDFAQQLLVMEYEKAIGRA